MHDQRNVVSYKPDDYIFDRCTRYLVRRDGSPRSSYLGYLDGDPRGALSEAWRFPVIDRVLADGVDAENSVTFVFYDGHVPDEVELMTTAAGLHRWLPLIQAGDTPFFSVSLRVPQGQVHDYLFLVDGEVTVDPTNPYRIRRDSGALWSRFFTDNCRQRLTLEQWEWDLLDRLTDHILPFRTKAAQRWIGTRLPNAYRLDRSVGVVNFIDKILVREEAHRRRDYRISLEIIRDLLRSRYPGPEPERLPRSAFEELYEQMADAARDGTNISDWPSGRYGNPGFFLALLRRHTWTGAFSHPAYGGNVLATGWRYLEDRYSDGAGATLFNWRRALEAPLGTDREYRG